MDRVDAGAAVDARQLPVVTAATVVDHQRGDVAGVQHEDVVASTAIQHVGATIADDRVVARARDNRLAGAGAGQRVRTAAAKLIHGGLVEGAAGGAEDDVASPGIGTSGRVAVGRPDNKIGQPVAVDIPGTRHVPAAFVVRALPVNDEPADARGHRRQIDRGSPGLPEHHVAVPRQGGADWGSAWRSNNEIGEPVAIDVPGTRHAPAA